MQTCDPINSGLTKWRLTVYVHTLRESGINPASKHYYRFSPRVENERADAGRVCIEMGIFSTIMFGNRVMEVCVCVFSSHSFWTSSSLDVPAGVTQDFSSTFFQRCVP